MKIAKFIALAGLIGYSAAQAAVQYIGASDGTVSTIIDLSSDPTATYGGSYDPSTKTWIWDQADGVILNNIVAIKNGNLVIPPGSVVRGQPRDTVGGFFNPGALLIARSAKLIAPGDVSAPIVFTTAATSSSGGRASGSSPTFWDFDPVNTPQTPTTAGLWGGVIILGNASTNVDRDGVGTQQFDEETAKTVTDDDRSSIEGIPTTASVYLSGDDRFGGQIDGDNSGVLTYASIRHGGANLTSNNEINGLTLGAVGSGTTINNIEIWGNTDDGVEIFGGTVNLSRIAIFGVQDDGLDIDIGYRGTVQYLFIVAANGTDRLFEWDGDYQNEGVNGFSITGPVTPNFLPFSAFTVANATIVGNKGASDRSHSLHLKDQVYGKVINSIVVNAAQNNAAEFGPIEVDNRSGVAAPNRTTDGFTYGRTVFKGVTFQSSSFSTVEDWVLGGSDDATVEASLSNPDYANIFAGSVGFQNVPTGGTLASGLNFNPRPTADADAVFEDPIIGLSGNYVPVSYRGAFDPNEATLWTADWTAADAYNLIVK